MSINSIGNSLALLSSAVKPATTPQAALDSNAQPYTKSVELNGKLNTFALSVYANVLESEQGLLDNQSPQNSSAANTVVSAGQSLASAQQATSAYKAAQSIVQTAPQATLNTII